MSDNDNGSRSVIGLTKTAWTAILLVYLILFAVTGYFAFLAEGFSPARMSPDVMNKFEQQDLKNYVIEILKEETTVYTKRRELAQQSFNVVLGAILGFLSASASSLFGFRREPPTKRGGRSLEIDEQ